MSSSVAGDHLIQEEVTTRMAGKPDPYEGIDFEEISEATGLAVDEIKCLKVFTLLNQT